MRSSRGRQRSPNAAKVDEIVEAMSRAELTGYDAWGDLDALSTHTGVDGIEVDPAGVTVEGEHFSGLATIYVALQYGSGDDDGFETSDAFEGKFEGHFEGKRPVIDKLTVDTKHFYE
jgi:hypothetical protein